MDGLKQIPLSDQTMAAVTTMRNGELFGNDVQELLSGNVIPRLCQAAGEGACAKTCQLIGVNRQEAGVMCAENNISSTIDALHTTPEKFALVAATKDNVKFGDSHDLTPSAEGYNMVPEANAYFFRPGVDGLSHIAMRMADCGSVMYEFKDKNDDLVLGQAHFSRTNMRGPSAYIHEINGQKVSWSEYVLASAIDHYGADPKDVKVTLIAAVEGEDFIHHYDTTEKMEAHFPGWAELGFMHPQGTEDFDCLIDYRQMIEWQLTHGITDEKYMLSSKNIKVDGAINTGDLSLGHASHHHATAGEIAHGRDMYVVGIDVKSLESLLYSTYESRTENLVYNDGDFVQEYDESIRKMTTILGRPSRG